MSHALEIRGETIHPKPPPGTIPVAGPYRPGTEDWALFRTINDFRRVGAEPIFVREQARADQGGFVGVSIYRTGVAEVAEEADADETEGEVPGGGTSEAPDGDRKEKRARRIARRSKLRGRGEGGEGMP